jgi:hypothetical protein
MLLLLFALSGPVIEPPQPEQAPATYYGSGKAQGEAELLQRVLDKYEVIEANQAKDKATQNPAETATIEPKPATKPQAKAIIEPVNLAPLENPHSLQAQQAREDDQIMALMALMLLED